MGTIRFVLRTDKKDKDGLAPVELIYQLSGKRKYHRTKEKLFDINWDANRQQAVYQNKPSAKKLRPDLSFDILPLAKDIDDLNNRLSGLRVDIADIEKRFELNGKPYNTEMVIETLKESIAPTTKAEQPSKYVYDFIDQYIKENQITRKKESLNVYSTLKSHLQKFEKHSKARVSFDDIDHGFFQKFQNYLLAQGGVRVSKTGTPYSKKGLTNTTVAKQLSTLKTFLSYARKSKVSVNEDYKMFTIEKESGPVIALTEEEFQALYHLDLKPGSPQDQVRDAFCLSCTTGLRYSDLKQLTWDQVKDREIVIYIIKNKAKVPLHIPLTPYSKAILKKYKGQPKPLQVISNQRMNDHLKGNDDRGIKSICEMAGITEPTEMVRYRGTHRESVIVPKHKLISAHNGRKTFVTLSLERGMTAEQVMAISNHKNYQSFARYVNVTNKHKEASMAKAWGDISKDKLKAV